MDILHTIYNLSRDPRGLSTDPHPPLLLHVVSECPLSGLLLNNFVLIFALLTSLHPQLRAAVVLAVKLTCQSFHFRIFEEKKSRT